MKTWLTRALAAMSLLGATLLVGCNTVEGAGRDVEAAGEKIQSANCTSADSANDPNCQK
jgi:predicted small secreted protein